MKISSHLLLGLVVSALALALLAAVGTELPELIWALLSFVACALVLYGREILRAACRKNRSVPSPSKTNGLPRANLLSLRDAPGRRALSELNPLLFIRGGGTVIQNRKFNIHN